MLGVQLHLITLYLLKQHFLKNLYQCITLVQDRE